jgi:hypothetical protein
VGTNIFFLNNKKALFAFLDYTVCPLIAVRSACFPRGGIGSLLGETAKCPPLLSIQIVKEKLN